LNTEQLDAVKTTNGAVLVIAGAGSGKTKALTYRIAYLLDQKLAYPNEILAVTFTNKASEEMKKRVRAIITNKALTDPKAQLSIPFMGTFHSICVKILRMEARNLGMNPNFVIYDSDDQIDAVKDVMLSLNLSVKEFNPKAIHSYISSSKNELVGPDDYIQYAQGYFQLVVAKVYPLYQKLLDESNAMDFDDLIFNVIKAFRKDPKLLEKYQKLFKYVLVDEYQDTNRAQYTLISMLSQKYGNICVVGDEDQSIYKFRGSDIRNILNFEKDYPKAKTIKLEQNYRSTKTILNVANNVIRHNSERRDKKMWTENIEGELVNVYLAESEKDEAWWIVKQIDKLRKENDTESVAVLYRTNAQSRNIEEALLKGGYPYKLVGGFRFYERKEVKDLIAYLRVINNPKDTLSLSRIINTPRRGIGKKSLDLLTEKSTLSECKAGELLLDPEKRDLLDPKLIAFSELLSDLVKKSNEVKVDELLKYLLEKTDFIKHIDDGTEEAKNRIENVKELTSVTAKYANLEARDSLNEFLSEIALIEASEEDTDKEEGNSLITLMTVHAAKGLEFDHVFIIGMEEGLFPHSRAFVDPSEMEEERRLAYVAVTRAKKNLSIIHAESRLYFGNRQANPASRFIEDIPDELIKKLSYEDELIGNLSNRDSYTSGYPNKYGNQSKYESKKSLGDDWSGWGEGDDLTSTKKNSNGDKYGNFI